MVSMMKAQPTYGKTNSEQIVTNVSFGVLLTRLNFVSVDVLLPLNLSWFCKDLGIKAWRGFLPEPELCLKSLVLNVIKQPPVLIL